MTIESRIPAVRGPVRRTERALAPDLARGAMLLLIALANAAGVVFASAPGVDPEPHGIDRVVNLIMFTLVHARAYPVFAVMFGYGLVQLSRRQRAHGATARAARSILLRRNAWLIVFGFVHAALLNYGDFLGAYGIVGIAITLLLLDRGERIHRLVLWIWAIASVEILVFGVLVARALLGGTGGSAGVQSQRIDSFAAPNYPQSMLDRLTEWPAHTLTVLPFIIIAWLGVWAARRRILEEPERHLTLLRWTAVLGLGIAILGGLPQALLSADLLHVDASAASLISLLYGGTGMFAGPGYVAVFGLLAHRWSHARRPHARPGLVITALTSLGQRSLSGYLLQSVAWLALLAPYTLALGGKFGSPTLAAAVVAAAVWLITVVLAHQLDRQNRPGPAELLLRRLTYGPRGSSGAARPR